MLVPTSLGDFLTECSPKEGCSRSYPKFDGSRFANPFSTWSRPGFWRALAFFLSREGRNFPSPLPPNEIINRELPVKKPQFDTKNPSSLELTWIGHSTVLLRMDDISVITDPVFSEYCSPFRFEMVRRIRPVPCSIDELPDDLQLVLISHNHYDHLDSKSIERIHQRYGNRVTFCVPKGEASWFRCNFRSIAESQVVEMSWWQTANFQLENNSSRRFQVTSLPAQHWSMRRPFSRNRTLWSSWLVTGPSNRKFYFAGDTGYCPAFKEIGAEFGPIDLAAIPIGAYRPKHILGLEHVCPSEAVQIHVDIKAKRSVAIHWGTFRLGGESILDPRSDLHQTIAELALPQEAFVTVGHGETLCI